MNKITALTILKATDCPSQNIGVICKYPKEVMRGVFETIYTHSSGKIPVKRELEDVIMWGEGKIYFQNLLDIDHGKMRGYRFDLLLIEGNFNSVSEKTLNEMLIPQLSVNNNFAIMHEVHNSFKGEIPRYWTKKPSIIFTEKNAGTKGILYNYR